MTWSRTLALCGVLAALGLAGGAGASESLDAEWSTRLLQHKARIERAQQTLDERNTAFAKAVAGGETEPRVQALRGEREVAAAQLEELERSLPDLVREARDAGVSEEVLSPYRFAVADDAVAPAVDAPAARD